MRVYGSGLVKGLKVTIKHLFDRKLTEQYPEERPRLFSRFRGRLAIEPEKCIACGICVRTCPNGVLTLQEGRDETGKKKKLESYLIDHQYCMFCNLCVENCPTGCLYFSHDFEWAVFSRADLKVTYQGPAARGLKETEAEDAAPPPPRSETDRERAEASGAVRDDRTEKKKDALKAAFAKDSVKILRRWVEGEDDIRLLAEFLKEQPQRAEKLLEFMAEDPQKAGKLAEALLKQARKLGGNDAGGEDR